MRSHPIVGGLLLAGLLAAATPAAASGLQIAPTGLQIAPGGPAQALWLTNTGDRELRAQVRAYRWSQANGKDDLEATQALVASPPMLNIPAGGRQLVRVIRTGQDAAAGEQAFRLLVDELPQGAATTTGVQYVLRYSVPVFVGAAPASAAALQWSNVIDHEQLHSKSATRVLPTRRSPVSLWHRRKARRSISYRACSAMCCPVQRCIGQ